MLGGYISGGGYCITINNYNAMKSEEILKSTKWGVDSYPADACFMDDIIGTFSESRGIACIMLEDNRTPEEIAAWENINLTHEQLVHICYTLSVYSKKPVLITNFGCDVHSRVKPKELQNLTIIKPSLL